MDTNIDTDTGVMASPAVEETHPNAIHLLRTMQAHHVTLSAMADQKANILIGVNSVIFALVVREGSAMTLPMLTLAASSSLAAVLCMLAVVPAFGAKKSKGPPQPPNILFFGAFTNLSEAEFVAELDVINCNDARIRQAMARDVYQLGQVLKQKKYRYLAMAYQVFIFGLILTFVVFVLSKLLG
ncbi:MAG: Pycsar system effector family protein [Polymorphobacter sp.]